MRQVYWSSPSCAPAREVGTLGVIAPRHDGFIEHSPSATTRHLQRPRSYHEEDRRDTATNHNANAAAAETDPNSPTTLADVDRRVVILVVIALVNGCGV